MAAGISEQRACMKHKPSSAILGFDCIIHLASLGDDWVNVDRVIDRKTARKLRQLAAQTGASVVTVLEQSIEHSLTVDEAKGKVYSVPEPTACTAMSRWYLKCLLTFCVTRSELIAILSRAYVIWQF